LRTPAHQPRPAPMARQTRSRQAPAAGAVELVPEDRGAGAGSVSACRDGTTMVAIPKPRGPMTWLAVRTWRFWLMAVIRLRMLYVASLGRACWWTATPSSSPFWVLSPQPRAMAIYWPLGWMHRQNLPVVHDWLSWWMTLGVARRHTVLVPTGPDSNA